MKLERYLTIGSTHYDCVAEQVILELNAAGRAMFTAVVNDADIPRFAVVTFEFNYTRFDSLQRLFLGYVDSVTRLDNKQVRVFCRELAGVLNLPLPLSLRHPTLTDVLTAISTATGGLSFSVPEADYATLKIPHFTTIGSGYNALNALGKLFKIPDYLWQQKDDGVIYVGAWTDADYLAIDLSDSVLFDATGNQSASIMALPTLRTGMVLNDKRIKQLTFSDSTMQVTW